MARVKQKPPGRVKSVSGRVKSPAMKLTKSQKLNRIIHLAIKATK